VSPAEIELVESGLEKIETALAAERGKWKARDDWHRQRVASLEAELRRTTAELAALRGPP